MSDQPRRRYVRPRHIPGRCRICLRALALEHERNRASRVAGLRHVAAASGLV